MDGIRAFVGQHDLEGKSTTEVCDTFIKTKTMGKSYCDQLNDEGNGDKFIKRGNVFVSHAWKYKFLSVVEAMTSYLENHSDPESVVFWFDVFSVNQNGMKDHSPPREWWNNTFKNGIAEIGTTVMVIEPWHDPITLTRAWCLWEVYCCSKSKKEFKVAMSDAEEKSFEESMCNDASVFLDLLGSIDIKRSEASNPVEKSEINSVILKADGGFEAVNKSVFTCLRNWAVQKMEKLVDTKTADPDLGKDHEDTLYAMNGLAALYNLVGESSKAEDLCEQIKSAYENKIARTALDDFGLLKCKSALAFIYEWNAKYSDARELHIEVLGTNQPHTYHINMLS